MLLNYLWLNLMFEISAMYGIGNHWYGKNWY